MQFIPSLGACPWKTRAIGQGEMEGAPGRRSIDPDSSSMCLHDSPRDIETQAQTLSVGRRPLFITLEDGLQAVGCDARAGIRDRQPRLGPLFVTCAFRPDRDPTALRRESKGIGEQVPQNLQDSLMVEASLGGFRRRLSDE